MPTKNIDYLEHLLFAAYLVFFAWLITKIKFFTKSGLTPAQLIIFFLLKVMAGIFYGWIGVYYGELAQMIDTWAYHYESLKEYDLLINSPSEFFSSLFHSPYQSGYGRFLASENSWWNDLKGNSLLKVLAFFNVLSFGNYYINLIFYSFLTLFGPIAIYRIMKEVFPTKKIPVLIATFLVPSFLYWTSGIHKDGIIFVGFALIIYHIYSGFRENKFPLHRIILIGLGLLLVLALRNFLIIPLIPALIAWITAEKIKRNPVIVFTGVFMLFIVLFFSLKYIFPVLDFPQAVADKQNAFLQLHGGSAVYVDELQPDFIGFIKNTPQAFAISTLRPYPSDVKHLLSLAAVLEINFLILLFLVFLIWRTNGTRLNPFILFCIFLSFSVLLMIGYTVHFLGAVVRYRSIILPFLIVPMIAKIDWQKVSVVIFGEIKNKDNI